ncbi:MAG: hypothetical protein KDD48_02185 [Bdellovibrionales bacterium]|nr:hypothetical protein [Bdellovibrionales bacterium]
MSQIKNNLKCLLLCAGVFVSSGFAKDVAYKITMIDVGAGLSAVLEIPNSTDPQSPYYILYDFGTRNADFKFMKALIKPKRNEFGETVRTIDLAVASHTDQDHIDQEKNVFRDFEVKAILRTGYHKGKYEFDKIKKMLQTQLAQNMIDKEEYFELLRQNLNVFKPTKTWEEGNEAIGREIVESGCIDLNLRHFDENGMDFSCGADGVLEKTYGNNISIKMVAGFSEPPYEDENLAQSESLNGASIALLVGVEDNRGTLGNKFLFTGDTVGRHEGSSDNSPPIAGERYMIEKYSSLIKNLSGLQLAHHGSDDASSKAFLELANPQYTLISAGHKHNHPRVEAVNRLIAAMIKNDRCQDENRCKEYVFRTDRDDQEDFGIESALGASHAPKGKDPKGDDHIEYTAYTDGSVEVSYIDIDI